MELHTKRKCCGNTVRNYVRTQTSFRIWYRIISVNQNRVRNYIQNESAPGIQSGITYERKLHLEYGTELYLLTRIQYGITYECYLSHASRLELHTELQTNEYGTEYGTIKMMFLEYCLECCTFGGIMYRILSLSLEYCAEYCTKRLCTFILKTGLTPGHLPHLLPPQKIHPGFPQGKPVDHQHPQSFQEL